MKPPERKRAIAPVSLEVLRQALCLAPGLHIEFVHQTPDGVAGGFVELIVSGEGLDAAFATTGAAVPGVFVCEEKGGETVTYVQPAAQKNDQ